MRNHGRQTRLIEKETLRHRQPTRGLGRFVTIATTRAIRKLIAGYVWGAAEFVVAHTEWKNVPDTTLIIAQSHDLGISKKTQIINL